MKYKKERERKRNTGTDKEQTKTGLSTAANTVDLAVPTLHAVNAR